LDGLGSVIGGHAVGSAKVNDVTKFSVGDKVGSPKLTVISDGLYPYGLMTGEFDDEGVPQRKVPIIVDGVFKGFVYDQLYALMDSTESTGNGLKQSGVFFRFEGKYGVQPGNQISNFYVEPGKVSYEDMIKDIKKGILVEQFSWLNPDVTTGKFSSEIRAGYYIRNGEIKEPIKGGLIIGNVFDMIKRIDCITDKSVICSGGTVFAGVCPYVSFEDVQIAGK
jgi:predicted Zn-dependent protease